MNAIKDQTRWRISKGDDGDYRILGKWGEIHDHVDGLDVWIHAFKPTEELEKRSERRANWIEAKGWKAKQHYDDGALFIRPFSDLDLACKFIKASKRRHLSEEQRKRAVERLQNSQFRKKDTHVSASKPDIGG